MNIYLYVEIAARELDSKLLLATLAAQRGHSVVISDFHGIIEGIKSKALSPGIFHDKSLTPNKNKISTHKFLIDNGFIVSSIDEENNLINHGYHDFAKKRFSEITIDNASSIFGWGFEDVETLKKIYPKYSSKIHMTGSPRIDLLNSSFVDYWESSSVNFQKPYLLISTNCHANNIKTFPDTMRHLKDAGNFKNDLKFFKNKFDEMAESYKRVYFFIEAIKYLSAKNKGYEIVLRPHPAENIEAWKVFLEDIPNVQIIREGPITPWINNSFALMHNGCTTAIEATILGKPVVTYVPTKLEHYTCEVPNSLGHKVKTLEELSNKLNHIFENLKLYSKNDKNEKFNEVICKKIYIDKNELAAEKIIKIWEKNEKEKFSIKSNLTKFQFDLKKIKFKKMGKKIFNKTKNPLENYKFPSLIEKDIINKVKKLKNILGIEKEIYCKLLSERTILIK